MTKGVNKIGEDGKMKTKTQTTNALSEFSEVTAVFERYPEPIREKLLELRQLILETAVATPGVGEIVETLKWNQPSYLTVHPKSGTTIRIDAYNVRQPQVGLFVHCQTNLISSFRQQYPSLTFEGNRAIILNVGYALPLEPLRDCIAQALTYHRNKK